MLPDPIPALRHELAAELMAAVDELHNAVAADLLGIDESRLSDLRHGRAERFSVDKLIRMLAKVNRTVELTVVNTGPRRLPWGRILRERR